RSDGESDRSRPGAHTGSAGLVATLGRAPVPDADHGRALDATGPSAHRPPARRVRGPDVVHAHDRDVHSVRLLPGSERVSVRRAVATARFLSRCGAGRRTQYRTVRSLAAGFEL